MRDINKRLHFDLYVNPIRDFLLFPIFPFVPGASASYFVAPELSTLCPLEDVGRLQTVPGRPCEDAKAKAQAFRLVVLPGSVPEGCILTYRKWKDHEHEES